MRKTTPSLLTVISCLLPLSQPLLAETSNTPQLTPVRQVEKESNTRTDPKFEPFTGKVVKNRVRLRLQPNFDGPIIKELSRDNLLIITGETEDFYHIQPSPDMKAYIYRTYVLDHVVEGTKVNVRLQPDLDAPVIAQLNSGDHVENGVVIPANNKWLEIKMPATTRFYVAKEYVEKVGDAHFITRLEKRREEAAHLLNTTIAMNQAEMQKPFDQINIDEIANNYKHLAVNYSDFPEVSAKAKELLTLLQENYISRKIAYLEAQAKNSSVLLENKNKQLTDELYVHRNKISELEQQLQTEHFQREKTQEEMVNTETNPLIQTLPGRKTISATFPSHMLTWMPVEDALFAAWSKETGNPNFDAFYREQQQKAFVLRGVVEPYLRPVKNKPGDYVLINPASGLPTAFLYSTKINLQDYVGHQVSVVVAPRPNNHFAYPAYFVITLE